MTSLQLLVASMFWISFALVAYPYVIYPLVIWLAARLFGRDHAETDPNPHELPKVSLLIAAHNEEDVIEARLQNALALDYPPGRLEIVVGSDGSDDATNEMVRGYADRGVRLLDYRQRRGKSAVLNSSVPRLTGDIIVFSDANTFYDTQAIRRLVQRFENPKVGAVCGRLVLTDPATGQNVDSLYWRYETFLKRCESRLGTLLGANGAIYALPKKHYVPIPDNTIIDDFVIPLLAKLHHNFRVDYEPTALAFEETPPTIQAEFRRRSRIGAGGYQSLSLLWRLLSTQYGWTAFCFLSHKILRWLAPFCLVGMMLANLALVEYPTYRMLLFLQLSFYGLSVLGSLTRGRSVPLRLIRVSTMFCSMNAALMVGFLNWMRSPQKGTWQRTSRQSNSFGLAK